ncbi:MAG: hypothetical protein K0S85_422 [Pseudomonas orientalis]|nr:hypothetical protein [Pseudomonas orientalis]
MKKQKDNSSTLPALLRTAGSVDTLETNSLCCAAAGIIVPSSATAETSIPHEKLRGAALADASLNAQKRPLAQPVVGYTPHSQGRAIEAEIFSDDELAALTGYKQRAHQRKWLIDRNWVFIESRGGRPLVGRMYARMKLGMSNPVLIEQSLPPTRPVWTPDFSRVN